MKGKAAATTVLVAWIGAVVVLHGAKIKTQAQADPAFNFREVKTWAWHPSGGGDVIMARSSAFCSPTLRDCSPRARRVSTWAINSKPSSSARMYAVDT